MVKDGAFLQNLEKLIMYLSLNPLQDDAMVLKSIRFRAKRNII